mgnify:FL=1
MTPQLLHCLHCWNPSWKIPTNLHMDLRLTRKIGGGLSSRTDKNETTSIWHRSTSNDERTWRHKRKQWQKRKQKVTKGKESKGIQVTSDGSRSGQGSRNVCTNTVGRNGQHPLWHKRAEDLPWSKECHQESRAGKDSSERYQQIQQDQHCRTGGVLAKELACQLSRKGIIECGNVYNIFKVKKEIPWTDNYRWSPRRIVVDPFLPINFCLIWRKVSFKQKKKKPLGIKLFAEEIK